MQKGFDHLAAAAPDSISHTEPCIERIDNSDDKKASKINEADPDLLQLCFRWQRAELQVSKHKVHVHVPSARSTSMADTTLPPPTKFNRTGRLKQNREAMNQAQISDQAQNSDRTNINHPS
jgi:hypothetical protein